MSFSKLDPSCIETCSQIITDGEKAIKQMETIAEFVIDQRQVQRIINALGDVSFKQAHPLILMLNRIPELMDYEVREVDDGRR
jgi:hypothetical protein